MVRRQNCPQCSWWEVEETLQFCIVMQQFPIAALEPIWSPLRFWGMSPSFLLSQGLPVGCALQHTNPIALCNCHSWIPIYPKFLKGQCPGFSLWTCSGEGPDLPFLPKYSTEPRGQELRLPQHLTKMCKTCFYIKHWKTKQRLWREHSNSPVIPQENCIESCCPSLEGEMLHVPHPRCNRPNREYLRLLNKIYCNIN